MAPLADVDVVNPDEKSIMTYVAQFLQYSKDAAETGDKAQVCPYKYDSRAFLLYPTSGLIFKTEVQFAYRASNCSSMTFDKCIHPCKPCPSHDVTHFCYPECSTVPLSCLYPPPWATGILISFTVD